MEPTGGVGLAVGQRGGERGWAGFGRLLGYFLVWALGAAQLGCALLLSLFVVLFPFLLFSIFPI
jgi:hypothetical protein